MRECEDCGEEIPALRLEVKPDARTCIDCQHQAERQGRFQRHQMSHEIRFKGDEIELMDSKIVEGGLRQ